MTEKISLKKSGRINTTEVVFTKAPYISYGRLEKTGIVHNAFSTRLGGVSEGIYESMNFSVKMGDSEENVRKNFEIFIKENGFKNPVMTNQTHTTNVRVVNSKMSGNGVFNQNAFEDVDGLITNERGITLVTTYADCVPLYFVDIKNRAIGLSHSGWRGTVGRMGLTTIKAMKEEYGTEPEDVIAAIGPSICANCYEVSKDVAQEFMNEFNVEAIDYNKYIEKNGCNAISQDMEHIIYSKNDGKYMLNLWAANYRVLREAGISDDNIEIPDICTCCNKNYLFSHRGHSGKRGNLCAFLMLN